MDEAVTVSEDAGEEAVRPRSRRVYSRKTEIVLTAAESVFLRSGYAATSMDEVAAEAGVSKRTVYTNFGSKEQLFADVITRRCAAVLPDPETYAAAVGKSPEEGLVLLATGFLTALFDPAQIELYQTVVAAARRQPNVGRIMFEGPILQTQNFFADFLRGHSAAGRLALEDVDLAAAQLIALLKTNVHMKLLFARPVQMSKKWITESARASVRLFLYGAFPRS